MIALQQEVKVKMLLAKTNPKSIILVAVAVVMLGVQQLSAQGLPPGRPSIGVQAFNACTVTDYASVAATALGITSAQLRAGIVKGQTLQEIASGANVPFQTLSDALRAARKVDIDQAVKDGVITQAEGSAMEAPPAGPATAPALGGTPPATVAAGSGPQPRPIARPGNQFPDISTINFLLQAAATPAATQPAVGSGPRPGIGGGFNASLFDRVKPYAVSAQALSLKCTDFVISLITPPGQSIPTVAAAQKIDPQVVSDALTKAYQNALAQDVTDNIITQAQSDQLSATLNTAVAAFVNNPTPMQARPPMTPTATP